MLAILGIVIYVFGMVWQTISIVYIYRAVRQLKFAHTQYGKGMAILSDLDSKSPAEKLIAVGGSRIWGKLGNRHTARGRLFKIKASVFKYGGWYCVIGLAVWFLGTALHL